MLWVDATNILQWGPNPPTGIPRVEASIAREVLARHSAEIGLFAFDLGSRRFRMLREAEKEFVRSSIRLEQLLQVEAARSTSWMARFRNALSVYRPIATCAGREAYRAIAQYLTLSPERAGLAYQLVRLLARLCFTCLRARQRLLQAVSGTVEADPLESGENNCLLSVNTVSLVSKHYQPERIKALLSLLIYDTIPLDYPDLAVPGHHSRFEKYFRFGVARASRLICISEATRRSVLHWCRDDPEASKKAAAADVVRIASSLSETGRTPRPVEELVGRSFVLYCATIEPRKNHLLLLRVWSRLLAKPSAVPLLVFAGRSGWQTETVSQRITDDRRLADAVRVYPSLSDENLQWLNQQALFCVFPSFAEGWGLGASEALDFGTPVLVSDISPLRDATQGLMPAIPPTDDAGWEAMVERLVAEPALLGDLRAAITEKYTRRSLTEFVSELVALVSARP
jgi:glycosyltransferase involved in cell wall biosynthesis